MVQRILFEEILNSCFKGKVILLIGPRQVGKTTLLKKIQTEIDAPSIWINIDEADIKKSLTEADTSTKLRHLVGVNTKVVFIDDVLFTGRSINAALTAIQSFGRPSEVELLVLIDRRFSRHLPIQPDYRGRQVDVINDEKVIVSWKEKDGEDAVYLV